MGMLFEVFVVCGAFWVDVTPVAVEPDAAVRAVLVTSVT
jgi:hypothetical protein